jgi:hypothetical protein
MQVRKPLITLARGTLPGKPELMGNRLTARKDEHFKLKRGAALPLRPKGRSIRAVERMRNFGMMEIFLLFMVVCAIMFFCWMWKMIGMI